MLLSNFHLCRINRNIMECKVALINSEVSKSKVLIETLWNVKKGHGYAA